MNASQVFPSELVDGGYAAFSTVQLSETNTILVNYSSVVRWDFMSQPFGSTIGGRFRAWAKINLQVTESGRYIITCAPCSTFFMDTNQTLQGDTYGLGYGQFAAQLSQGEHVMYVPIVAYGPTFTLNVDFSAVDAKSGWQTLPNEEILLPTIVDNYLMGQYISITIMNVQAEQTIGNITVSEANGLPVSVLFNPRIVAGQAVQVVIFINQTMNINTSTVYTLSIESANAAAPIKLPFQFPFSSIAQNLFKVTMFSNV